MKSKQLNFYSLPSEVSHFQKWLIDQGVLFIEQPIANPEKIFDTTNSIPNRNNEWSKMYLTSQEYTDQIFLNLHDKSGLFYVDELKSLVIEFSRPELDTQGRLPRCRIYFIYGAYVGETFYEKDAEFVIWANKLMKNFKKNFLVTFVTPQANYATKNFAEYYDESIKLTI